MTYRLPLASFDAIIFDFDGVILESGAIKTQAFLDLFSEHDEHRDSILAHHLQNLGVSRFEKFAWIYRELLREPLPSELRAELGRRYSRLVFDRMLACPMVPGAGELLDRLGGRLPCFVASATPHEELVAIIETRGLADAFEAVFGSPPGKNELVSTIVRTRDFAPDRVLMIGDGVTDLEAATAAGCRFLARFDQAAPRQSWPPETLCVDDLRQIEVIAC